MGNEQLNGSVDLLAKAMRQVFTEAVESAVQPLATEVKALRTEVNDMEGRLNARIDTTNENMQAQFAQHRKDVAADMATMEQRLRKDVAKDIKSALSEKNA